MARRIRVRLRHDDSNVSDVRRRDVPFITIQNVVLARLNGRRFHARCIGSSTLFGHRVANALLPLNKWL